MIIIMLIGYLFIGLCVSILCILADDLDDEFWIWIIGMCWPFVVILILCYSFSLLAKRIARFLNE